MPTRSFSVSVPLKNDDAKGKRRKGARPQPKPPRDMKANYQRSAFYYWWAFLREHPKYVEACEAGGEGRYAELYADFGDVRGEDFWLWWKERQHVFAEPPLEPVSVLEQGGELDAGNVYLKVPLDGKLSFRLRQIRRILEKRLPNERYLKRVSRAKRQVIGKPVIASLAVYLHTWQLRTKYPKLPYSVIYNITMGKKIDIDAALIPKKRIGNDEKKDKSDDEQNHRQMGYRNYRHAKSIMDNILSGKFPVLVK